MSRSRPSYNSCRRTLNGGATRRWGQGLQKGLSKTIGKTMRENPEDVGLFAAVFFLNYVRLGRGE